MTGQLPFVGTPRGGDLAAKQKQARRHRPTTLVDGLPQDLVRLCVALLDRDAAKRPAGREVIARLSGRLPEPIDAPEPARPFPLIGRSRHRQVLDSRCSPRCTGGRRFRSSSSAGPEPARPR